MSAIVKHAMVSAVCRWGAVVLVTSAMACTPRARDFGYAPDDAALSEIVVGSDTSSRVEELVGRPGTAGVVGESAWYYIASRQETVLWRAPEITDRQVVAISFDDAGTVRNVERFTLEDGRVVALSRRVTDDNTTGISFLRQLLGNLGNFTADQFVEP